MTDNIEESDAVTTDPETGQPRFKTTEINIRPLKNRKIELIWTTLGTISLTGLTMTLLYLLTL